MNSDSSHLPLIVEPDQLLEHLDDNNLLIIDLYSDQNYIAGHIPGAAHVSPRELVCGTPPATGKLPEQEQLNQLLSRLGLTTDTHVIVYDDQGGDWAGRFKRSRVRHLGRAGVVRVGQPPRPPVEP